MLENGFLDRAREGGVAGRLLLADSIEGVDAFEATFSIQNLAGFWNANDAGADS